MNNEKNNCKKIAVCFAGINEEFQGKICKSISDRVYEMGYMVVFFYPFKNTLRNPYQDRGGAKIYNLIDHDVFDAVIIITHTMINNDHIDGIISKAEAAGTPVVMLGSYDNEYVHQIDISTHTLIDKLTEHLITDHCCRSFFFMSGLKDERISQERYNSFSKAIKNHKIAFDENDILYGKFTHYDASVQLKKHLETKKLPDAIVCANDTMAIGVMDTLKELGYKVPENTIVTGFDGIKEGTVHTPTLTTISESLSKLGIQAVDVVTEILNGGSVSIHPDVNKKIVYGGSCGCGSNKQFDDNMVHADLFRELYGMNYYTERFITMDEDLTDSLNLNDFFKKLNEFSDDIYTEHLYICIDEEMFGNQISAGDLIEDFASDAFPEKVTIKVANNFRNDLLGQSFDAKEIIPDLFALKDRHRAFMVTPLHYRERLFGYSVISFSDNKTNPYLYNMWLKNISTALENFRVRTQWRTYAKKLNEIYMTDTLTGLNNRYGYYKKADRIFKRCKEEGVSCMFFSADMDKIKSINDRHGHEQGDRAIKVVADALKYAADKNVVTARVGGDEFLAIGYNYSMREVATFSQKFFEFLDDHNYESEDEYDVEASTGAYVVIPNDETDMDECVRISDERMYEAKEKKRRM